MSKRVAIRLEFRDELDAVEWFILARRDGQIAMHAGLRHADGLDRGRPGGDLIVTREHGAGEWLVRPSGDVVRGVASVIT